MHAEVYRLFGRVAATTKGTKVTSLGLDSTTYAQAMQALEDSFLGNGTTYNPINHDQRLLVGLMGDYGPKIRQLTHTTSLAAISEKPLNAFLAENRFDIRLDPFRRGDIGAVAILDMLVEWVNAGTPGTLWHTGTSYPAFELGSGDVELYEVPGQPEPLVQLLTNSGDSVWLIKPQQAPRSNFEASMMAQRIASAKQLPQYGSCNVVAPNLEVDFRPDTSTLVGMGVNSPKLGYLTVSQLLQQYKLRMNAHGARGKVATAAAMSRGGGPTQYKFNEPFLFYMTEKGHEQFAIMPLFADTDVWKDSGQSLEDL